MAGGSSPRLEGDMGIAAHNKTTSTVDAAGDYSLPKNKKKTIRTAKKRVGDASR